MGNNKGTYQGNGKTKAKGAAQKGGNSSSTAVGITENVFVPSEAQPSLPQGYEKGNPSGPSEKQERPNWAEVGTLVVAFGLGIFTVLTFLMVNYPEFIFKSSGQLEVEGVVLPSTYLRTEEPEPPPAPVAPDPEKTDRDKPTVPEHVERDTGTANRLHPVQVKYHNRGLRPIKFGRIECRIYYALHPDVIKTVMFATRGASKLNLGMIDSESDGWKEIPELKKSAEPESGPLRANQVRVAMFPILLPESSPGYLYKIEVTAFPAKDEDWTKVRWYTMFDGSSIATGFGAAPCSYSPAAPATPENAPAPPAESLKRKSPDTTPPRPEE